MIKKCLNKLLENNKKFIFHNFACSFSYVRPSLYGHWPPYSC